MASTELFLKEEEDCATCSDRCADVLEYPKEILGSIDRSVSVQGTGAFFRWQIVMCSGVSASKWPSRVNTPDSYAELCDNVVEEIVTARGDEVRVRVNLITKGSEDGGNPEEACDIIIFPEHVRYLSVRREQLKDVLEYHFNVIGPRYDKLQQEKKDKKDGEPIAVSSNDVDNGDDNDHTSEHNNSNVEIPSTISPLFKPIDIETSKIGIPSTCSTPNPFPLHFPYKNTIFLCGHKLRDKRCGVTAPILYQQFEDIFEAKGIYEENDDYFMDLITHVGGHKYAGNVIIHTQVHDFECVWYGRVLPEHCENIVNKTLIDGEILRPITRACHKDLF